jgi:phosphoribosylanthranilate isomerase
MAMRTPAAPPAVKICCIANHVEARLAVAAGAHAIGLVSAMPSGPGVIGESLIADIASAVPQGVETFLLTAHVSAEAIAAQHRRCPTTTLQLVDRLERRELETLRVRLPDVCLVQVVHVLDDSAVDEARAAAPIVDAILLDSGDPRRTVKALGGTGRVHDWSISRRVRDAVACPVWLAGGLDADNAARAVDAVVPFGLDVCSGVRRDGRLDPLRLHAFFAAVARARSEAAS